MTPKISDADHGFPAAIIGPANGAVATKREMERAASLADDLATAFCWADTREGYAYWEKIYSRLGAIADGKPL